MEYIRASKAAKKWGVSKPCVYRAAKEGRIPGAEFIDGYWYIPEDAGDPPKKRHFVTFLFHLLQLVISCMV